MIDRVSARRRTRVYIGLGANVGDAATSLALAVIAVGALPGVRLRAVSRLYATAPWGVTDQADFLNAAVAVDVPAGRSPEDEALSLLVRLKDIERDAGRRAGRRWGPRELDLDLLVFGRHSIRVERPAAARSIEAADDPAKAARLLEVPHRDLRERLFALAPMADLAAGLVPPGWTRTIESRRRAVAEREPAGSVRPVAAWDAAGRAWIPPSSAIPRTLGDEQPLTMTRPTAGVSRPSTDAPPEDPR